MSIRLDGKSIFISKQGIIINGVDIELPKKPGNHTSITNINGKMYVNGYELIEKEGQKPKFKRTLKALYYLYF